MHAQPNAMLDYIDAHIEDRLNVAQVAAQARYSPYHFNRLFTLAVGLPVKEYIRMRKLQFAAARVVEGDRLLDVALRFGFGSHESFTRAFKRQFGMTPQRFRMRQQGVYNIPPQHKWRTIKQGDRNMNARQERLPQRILVGYRFHTQPGSMEIAGFWKDVMEGEKWQRLAAKAADNAWNYGLCIHPKDMPEGKMDYLIAFDYDGKSPVDADMELFTLEAARYMVFPADIQSLEDKPAAIGRAWEMAYTQGLPAAGLTADSYRPDFEVYHGPEEVEIFIPVG